MSSIKKGMPIDSYSAPLEAGDDVHPSYVVKGKTVSYPVMDRREVLVFATAEEAREWAEWRDDCAKSAANAKLRKAKAVAYL